jgi:DNA modification methylase
MNQNLTIIPGDCRVSLAAVPDASVQCCVTSPPYWGLRSYLPNGHPQKALEIGQEKTPELFVASILAVMREVKRVLRPDGTLWVNLGDSYAGSDKGRGDLKPSYKQMSNRGTRELNGRETSQRIPHGLKPKDLVGIPWLVAFALRADGWYLRSDIIWAKRNCMPESVTDRPTRSHEYIFLLSKSPKYFYDHEAIKEPCIYDVDGTGTAARKARASADLKSHPTSERAVIRPPSGRSSNGAPSSQTGGTPGPTASGGYKNSVNFAGKNKGAEKQRDHSRRHDGFNSRWDAMEKTEQCAGMRNKRDVWTIAPANYPEAHFATFPPALITPCIRAGSRPGDTVLDPFGGSGTTAEVAIREGRLAIVCELNAEYHPLIQQRTNTTPGLALA